MGCLILATTACASHDAEPSKTSSLLSGRALDAEITRLMAAEDVKGLAVAVIERDEITHLAAYGYRNVESALRSEERRVGKECRSRWSPYH